MAKTAYETRPAPYLFPCLLMCLGGFILGYFVHNPISFRSRPMALGVTPPRVEFDVSEPVEWNFHAMGSYTLPAADNFREMTPGTPKVLAQGSAWDEPIGCLATPEHKEHIALFGHIQDEERFDTMTGRKYRRIFIERAEIPHLDTHTAQNDIGAGNLRLTNPDGTLVLTIKTPVVADKRFPSGLKHDAFLTAFQQLTRENGKPLDVNHTTVRETERGIRFRAFDGTIFETVATRTDTGDIQFGPPVEQIDPKYLSEATADEPLAVVMCYSPSVRVQYGPYPGRSWHLNGRNGPWIVYGLQIYMQSEPPDPPAKTTDKAT